MKAIMISVRPQWVAKILNGEKTIEIRKKFSKDFVGWVYIYVTRNKPYLYHERTNIGSYDFYELTSDGVQDLPNYKHAYTVGHDLNGKVVARFWCDKVEEILARKNKKWYHLADTIPLCEGDIYHICQKTCLSQDELHDYLQGKNGTAIRITNLEIFDKPKEISEFYKVGYENSVIATKKYILYSMNREERRKYKTELDLKINKEIAIIKDNYKLTRAPQSWCYVEIEE